MSYFGDSGSGCGSYSNNRNCESVDGNSEIEMRFESDSGGSADESHNHLMGMEEKLTREERRRRRRATPKYRKAHASRERVRVEAFNGSFANLRSLLPTLPPDKRLSKIEILRLAICYIAYLNHVLER
ncbi:helix-loop-helix protein 2 [Folsomia candida]|uniref:Helix-loop-helix protein 1 n=1 Tax=Folsomia candida TaxID=158441 RepID=A0A226ETR6_FOLCA|nr:helix-loop-helix protein 2 [Folsomia candida]OXA60630.1 Helix-loop-helix protein 1 [Folsomia candida]